MQILKARSILIRIDQNLNKFKSKLPNILTVNAIDDFNNNRFQANKCNDYGYNARIYVLKLEYI
jgi:hypothetical protein